jgi:hypothetical protein
MKFLASLHPESLLEDCENVEYSEKASCQLAVRVGIVVILRAVQVHNHWHDMTSMAKWAISESGKECDAVP